MKYFKLTTSMCMKTYNPKGNTTLLILNQKTSKKVLIDTVVLLEGDVNYTIFHLENGNQNMVAHSLKFFEPFLETHGFLRVHRSFMINPNHVKNLDKQQHKVTMINGYEAVVSRRKKRIFKNLL
ncbi:LytTR family DNA-binding domain-containing protein [Arcicella sp. LKC2W]|uniref:LytR/AlgR family response regulator transcription factor n=1 Tax=Arcicella sp. LKC2W TaxID=2984198 RepID=UPI002B2169DA|nr:LytTR family DNA-binding domain-containing protein [Arcicella sp. LKC2W]MEA5460803.1 LytTR family DNA-binding domain-containing protein [Arcicella sp. LKC2W]